MAFSYTIMKQIVTLQRTTGQTEWHYQECLSQEHWCPSYINWLVCSLSDIYYEMKTMWYSERPPEKVTRVFKNLWIGVWTMIHKCQLVNSLSRGLEHSYTWQQWGGGQRVASVGQELALDSYNEYWATTPYYRKFQNSHLLVLCSTV